MNNNTKGIIYALSAVIFFGTFGVSSKLATSTIDGISLTIWMIFFSTIALFFYLLYNKKHTQIIPELKKRPWFFIIMGFIGIFLHQFTYVKSYELLKASEVMVIFYIYPLLMMIISRVFLKEKMSFTSTLFVISGFIGLFIAVSKGNFTSFDFNLLSLLVLFTAFLWAAFSVFLKRGETDSDIGMFLFSVTGIFFLLCMTPFFNFHYLLTGEELGGVLYIAIFATALPFILWSRALHVAKVSICSNIAILTPVIALTLAALVLGEKINIYQLIGFGIILASTFINLNIINKDKN